MSIGMTVTKTCQERKAGEGVRPRRRILILGHSPLQGGAELCLDTLLRHLTIAKEDIFVILPWDGPLLQSARDMGYTVDIIPLAWWMNWPHSFWHYKRLLLRTPLTIWQLVRYIKKNRIDLVYTNTISIFESAFAAKLARVPHIWHVHEVLRDKCWTHQVLPLALIKRLILYLSDNLIYESHSSMKVFEGDNPSPRSLVIYNSLRFDLDDNPLRNGGQGRERCGLPKDGILVGFVGQFTDRKNPLLLIRAISLIKDRSNTRFVFVGDGPLRAEMTSSIESLGLSDRCQIIDFQDDIRWVFEMIDLLVLPSREESFGLVLVEAGAYGKPVIATRTQGPTEIVVDGETGFLVDGDNEAQLAEKIETLLSSESERRRLGAAASRRVHELFSAARNTHKVEQLIGDVLGRMTVLSRHESASRRSGFPA
jgi:glycosyltransferase involved in cell wall biosynthesis